MGIQDTPAGLTTALFVAFALFVMYTRMRNWLDSNIPIFFYLVMVVYANTLQQKLPPPVVYIGFALGLVLRFEFMNTNITRFVKAAEFCVLAGIVFLCLGDVVRI